LQWRKQQNQTHQAKELDPSEVLFFLSLRIETERLELRGQKSTSDEYFEGTLRINDFGLEMQLRLPEAVTSRHREKERERLCMRAGVSGVYRRRRRQNQWKEDDPTGGALG